ncbi:type II toxin-antitoxin system RelE/ParE family toxin [Blastomonas sp.]|uniref:type II toxin-antitoxin system RelE/ParE family toxin n=1 Tax=Blastomonas sp. TaxID=1909299 RepID=UPI003592F498
MTQNPGRMIDFVGSSLKDVQKFPDEMKQMVGHALEMARAGLKHPDAKPLKCKHGASLMELVLRFDGDAYRVVYTTRFVDAVYCLHAFKKKSHHGIATPEREIALIKKRFADLQQSQKQQGSSNERPKRTSKQRRKRRK